MLGKMNLEIKRMVMGGRISWQILSSKEWIFFSSTTLCLRYFHQLYVDNYKNTYPNKILPIAHIIEPMVNKFLAPTFRIWNIEIDIDINIGIDINTDTDIAIVIDIDNKYDRCFCWTWNSNSNLSKPPSSNCFLTLEWCDCLSGLVSLTLSGLSF